MKKKNKNTRLRGIRRKLCNQPYTILYALHTGGVFGIFEMANER